MKSSVLTLSAVVVSLLAVGTGCAAEGEVGAQPNYPTNANGVQVGYSSPQQQAASGQYQAQAPAAVDGEGQPVAAPPAAPDAPEQLAAPGAPAATATQTGEIAIGAQPEPAQVQVQAAAPAPGEYAETDPSALTDFRTTLDPYGSWVDDSQYGTVWVPSTTVVGAEFSPYVSSGHWTYDNEYVWVSDYSWGWAPFHYGRWTYIGGRGWGWIPGRTYAGAWVSWRSGYDDWGYVGWAPLGPSYYWRGGYAYGIGFPTTHAYVFCGTHDIFRPVVASHIVTGSQVGVVASHTRAYVTASPGVGINGTTGRAMIAGPPPARLGIHANAVVAPPTSHPGLAQARGFAHASTATQMGGRAPTAQIAHNGGTPGGALSHNNPRAGQAGTQYHGQPGMQPHAQPGMQPHAQPGMQPHAQPTYRSPSAQPTYRSQPAYRAPSQPAYRAPQAVAPRYSAPAQHYSPPAQHYSPPAQHYSPPSQPSYHSPAPTYHAPSGGGHSGGYSGGGGHSSGGGGRRR